MSSNVPPRSGGARKSPPRPGPQRKGKQANFRAQKRRQQQYLAAGAVVVVIAIIAVLVGLKAGGSGSSGTGEDKRSAISSASLNSVLDVTPAAMKTAAQKIQLDGYPLKVGGAALTSAGKPELLYIGAEYCPYCAGERWAMVMALSQFGTFKGLRAIESDPNDNPAAIPTFTFFGSTYSSPYLTFRPVETETVSGKALETPSHAELANEQTYDGPPYVKSGGIPYLNFGGAYVQDGINYTDLSMQHKSFDSIATQLGGAAGPQTAIAGSIAATAGVLVSQLCRMTGGKSLNGNAACQAFPSVVTSPATA